MKLLRIFAFLLLVAVVTETLASKWLPGSITVVLKEKEEKSDAKDGEKETGKDKLNQHYYDTDPACSSGLTHGTNHFFRLNAVYLAHPEMPPDPV